MQGAVPEAEGQPSLPPTRKVIPTPGWDEQAGLPRPPTAQRPERLTPSGLDAALVFPGETASSDALYLGSSVFRIVAQRNSDEGPDGIVELPEIGRTFLGFQLLAELGRGTFGRVYLGRQGELANRLVALKVSTESVAESQKLARLQHTHIVPVYSLHQAGLLQAVCMPYLGSTTLADVLHDLGRRDSLPESGKGLISTLAGKKSRTQATLQRQDPSSSGPQAPPAVAVPDVLDLAAAPPSLRLLERCTYVEAILWIGSRLADGLAHAHERGIIHRDLKPANVLLTDDGQPMLLDFNLAEDSRGGQDRASVGGTLPYMAPEHLAAFADLPSPVPGRGGVDARCDIYALGVILYELVTARHPFVRHPGSVQERIPPMIADRLRPPPGVRALNPTVTPAVESIIRHCLQPDPARRYQSAQHLREDIERHLHSEPLRHAPEPVAERARKWRRRHPRLASFTTLSVVSAVLLVSLGLGLLFHREELRNLEVQNRLKGFEEDRQEANLYLTPGLESEETEKGRQAALRALGRFAVLEQPASWREQPALARLSKEDREGLPARVGEVLLRLASVSPDGDARAYHELACACFPEEKPRALWEQRARLLKREGKAEEAWDRARTAQLSGAHDRFLWAVELAAQDRIPETIAELNRALKEDPTHYAAWFLLGHCHLRRPGFEQPAIAAFTACNRLRDDLWAAWFNRALAYSRGGLFELAEADLSRVIELRPGYVPAVLLRAAAREKLRKFEEATADLDGAEKEVGVTARTLLIRASIHEVQGDAKGSRQCYDKAMTLTPADEEAWVARGVARVRHGDAKGALGDFDQALQLNRRSFHALYNRTHVLADHLHRPAEAIRGLDVVLKLFPDYVRALSSRGVLLARVKRDAEALRDAEAALKQVQVQQPGFLNSSTLAEVRYQVAGVYALCSRREPKHRAEAFRLLALALLGGFGHDELETDDDLAPIRSDPRFDKLKRTVRVLQELASRSPRP